MNQNLAIKLTLSNGNGDVIIGVPQIIAVEGNMPRYKDTILVDYNTKISVREAMVRSFLVLESVEEVYKKIQE